MDFFKKQIIFLLLIELRILILHIIYNSSDSRKLLHHNNMDIFKLGWHVPAYFLSYATLP